MAVHEGRIAIAQIRRLQSLNDPRRVTVRALESWRQAYVQASNNAAQAIDQLWDQYRWPQDAARERRFEWQPVKDFRR